MDGRLVGIIQVPIAHLRFRHDLAPRELDPRTSERLASRIRLEPRPFDPENRVGGVVDEYTLSLVLADLRMSREQLQHTVCSEQYPCLPSRWIEYVHGQHRIEAARAELGDGFLWVVELRWFRELSFAYLSVLHDVKSRAERFSHETPYSDGECYLNIAQNQDRSDSEEVLKWAQRLTYRKNLAYGNIQGRDDMNRLFDALRAIRGLWPGKRLGSYAHYFALHCDEQMYHYFESMHQVWLLRIAHGDPDLLRHVDPGTVRFLEGLAPGANERDRALTEAAFDKGQIFGEVADPELRSAIRRDLLQVSVIIPSFRTFHEHMKYFSIAAKIIRTLLLRDDPGAAHGGRARSGRSKADPEPSLVEALWGCWSEPENAVVEVGEGEFQPVVGPFTFHQAVQSLLLVPLRQFPYLSTKDAPRVDGGDEVVPAIRPGSLSLLYKRAQLFGFRNKRIDEGAARLADESTPICEDVPCEGVSVVAKNRRWGRPHTRTLRAIQQVGFLPQLADPPGWACEPSVLLVFRSFFQAFLGPCTVSLDRQKPTVSLNYHVGQRGGPPATPNASLRRTVSPSEHGDTVMMDASRDAHQRVLDEAGRTGPASPDEAPHGAPDPWPNEDTCMTDSSPVRDTWMTPTRDTCMADSPDEDSCMLDSPAPDTASQTDGYSEPPHSPVPTQHVLPSLASLLSDPGLGHPGPATTIASGSLHPSLPLSPERPPALGSPHASSMMSSSMMLPAPARGSTQDWRTTRSDYSILAPSRRDTYWNSMTTQPSAQDGPLGAPASPRLPRLPLPTDTPR
ncbi:hypothetical protein PG985_004867 [Apiospora marii]|uniref:uncharacterized protein n=1 Tax=Apiospora marii TaxID=335849 RepID=UPI00312ED7B4